MSCYLYRMLLGHDIPQFCILGSQSHHLRKLTLSTSSTLIHRGVSSRRMSLSIINGTTTCCLYLSHKLNGPGAPYYDQILNNLKRLGRGGCTRSLGVRCNWSPGGRTRNLLLCRYRDNVHLRRYIQIIFSCHVGLMSSAFDIYTHDISGVCMSDFNVFNLITSTSSMPAQLYIHHGESYGGLSLLGAHRHVNSIPRHYNHKVGRWSFRVYSICFWIYDVGLCSKVFMSMLLVITLGRLSV